MEKSTLMDALVQCKRIGNLLNEVEDLSRQIAEAVDRNDQVTVQMLLAMRREPIDRLKVADQALREQRKALDSEEAQRLSALLNGAAADSPEEQPLADQVAANERRLKQTVELDKAVSRKLARDKSVYLVENGISAR